MILPVCGWKPEKKVEHLLPHGWAWRSVGQWQLLAPVIVDGALAIDVAVDGKHHQEKAANGDDELLRYEGHNRCFMMRKEGLKFTSGRNRRCVSTIALSENFVAFNEATRGVRFFLGDVGQRGAGVTVHNAGGIFCFSKAHGCILVDANSFGESF